MNQFSDKPLQPQIVLGIAAHPDDLDFMSGGTMALFAAQGAKVHYLILTDGCKGTADRNLSPDTLIEKRHDEQCAALKKLGGEEVTFLNYCDGCLEVTMDLKRDIVRVIRAVRPDTIITVDPSMIYSAQHGFINHPDHRAAGQAALDATFPMARDHLSFPELCDEGLEPHKTPTILLSNFDTANYYIDIGDTFERKIDALEAHASQIKDRQSLETMMRKLAEADGKQAGCELAEGFVRINIQD